MDKEHDTELLARVAAHDALGYTATALLDLDDSLLRYIFHMLQPLPDVFSMAQTCWRMRRVTHDKQRWLVVAPAGYDLQRLAAAPSGRTYLTLAAAVSASRPGDTLWLAPHTCHAAAGVSIPWPLQLLGGGARPEDTWLTADKGADCVLDFSATAKLARVAVAATLAPCLIHRSGTLTVDQCLLTSDAQGLAHLVSPLLTYATHKAGPAVAVATTAAAVAAAPVVAAAGRGASTAAGAAAGESAAAAAEGGAAAAGATPGSAAVGVHRSSEEEALVVLAPTACAPAVDSHHTLFQQQQQRRRRQCHSEVQEQQLQEEVGLVSAAVHLPYSSRTLCTTTTSSSSSGNCSPWTPAGLHTPAAAAAAAGVALRGPALKPCRPPAGPGRLCVTETQLKGGAAGVRCEGNGRLKGVRVIYESHAAFFWLEVDSSDPGVGGYSSSSSGGDGGWAVGGGVKRLLTAAVAQAGASGKRPALTCGQEAAAGGGLRQLAEQQQEVEAAGMGVGPAAAAAAAGEGGSSGCGGQELTGLARIQALLGSRAQLLQEQLAAARV